MKKILYILILGLISSCGSDNKTSSSSNDYNNNNPWNPSGIVGTATTIDQFISAVQNGQFAAPVTTTGLRGYQYLLHNGHNSWGGNGSDCKKKWGIFYYCSYSSFNPNNYYTSYNNFSRDVNGTTITRIAGKDDANLPNDVSSLRNYLANKLITAKGQTNSNCNNPYGQCVWVEQYKILNNTQIIYIDNGYCYLIDLQKPLEANPTEKAKFQWDQCSGQGYTFQKTF